MIVYLVAVSDSSVPPAFIQGGTLANASEELEKLLQQLERQREELRVKISLAKLEAREEWEKLDKKWESIKENAPRLREEFDATAGNVGATLRKAAHELRDGYVRLRKLL